MMGQVLSDRCTGHLLNVPRAFTCEVNVHPDTSRDDGVIHDFGFSGTKGLI